MAERPRAGAHAASMRLDLFLWYVRVARTRAAAQAIAATGRLRLDGRLVERAHAPVRIGSVLTFAQGPSIRALRVEALPTRRGPAAEAQGCYTELTTGTAEPPAPAENVSQQPRLD